MPHWWGKSSSKETKKKVIKEITFDTVQQKAKPAPEENSAGKSGGSHQLGVDIVSDRDRVPASQTQRVPPSLSAQVSRCQSFAEWPIAQSLPLPLPGIQFKRVGCMDSETSSSAKLGSGTTKPLLFTLPRPQCRKKLSDLRVDGDLVTAFVSSDSSTDSDDPLESRLPSPQASDYECGKRNIVNSPTSVMYKEHPSTVTQKNLKETMKPEKNSSSNQILPTSSIKERRRHMSNLQIPHRGTFGIGPDSSMSSPARSPLRRFIPDQVINKGPSARLLCSDMPLLGSGHGSSPGSGCNSGNNSVACDMSGQLLYQRSRCSPEYSPIPSPTMTSSGPASRIHSGAVTPLHPRAGGKSTESPTSRLDDGKQQSHRLPLPPTNCSFSPRYSPSTTPVPRSPARVETPESPGPRWTKGRLLGRGTFGQVYLGFNRDSGEMCAMKEVTLFSDDAKSKESAQQLGQEIALLSRLQHPNIVQYYGTETVGDKLYIYLEFVSGGSIHKLLQDYGMLGEIAIRSFTRQILSGLAYLHGKNTVHRDIKGANILVDPNGRVKLADFGMAKHITGHSCPLSFKGSPYWMAPEVITNSSGCNLALDIWSLGCTVLEMATAKPPWSHYEGVAALFKISNSKELPAIPDHLSNDGKDFVRKCLQRDPSLRPTASQLLEHPFVRNTIPLERPMLSDPLASTDAASGVAKCLATGEGMARYQSRVPNICSGSSEAHTPRNISHPVSPIGSPHLRSKSPQQMSGRRSPSHISSPCTASGSSIEAHTPRNISRPVSPIGSPHLRSKSPQQMSGRRSPSHISSPCTASGSSTPLTCGLGDIPIHHQRQPPIYSQYGAMMVPRSPTHLHTRPNTYYHEASQVSPVCKEVVSSENVTFANHRDIHNGQSVLADRVSQLLLRGHLKLDVPVVDLNPNNQTLDCVRKF